VERRNVLGLRNACSVGKTFLGPQHAEVHLPPHTALASRFKGLNCHLMVFSVGAHPHGKGHFRSLGAAVLLASLTNTFCCKPYPQAMDGPNNGIILYHYSFSPYARRVIW
jgi:hypothetical protein